MIGISGTTFERPDFKRMLEDIETKRINLVITKDLSRLGRDTSEMGYYTEKYFPIKKVRYIAVNDGYDSFIEDNYANDFAPFKNVFNEMYAKDISKKVITSLRTKQQKGEYIGTTAPFGYIKDPNTKGKLIVDPISSEYVKKIFSYYLSGDSLLTISNKMSLEKIPTPSEYRNLNNTQKYIQGAWNDKTVRFILRNEVYIGHVVQHKRKKINYKLKKQIDIPKKEWIKVENTHEPIIAKEDFAMVQDILGKRSYKPRQGKPHLLTGFLFCGNCGNPINFINQYQKGKYYTICSTAKKMRSLGICETSLIKEELVEEYISESLRDIAKKYIRQDSILKNVKKTNIELLISNKEKQKHILITKIDKVRQIKMNLYKDKVDNIIDEKTFLEMVEDIDKEKSEHEQQIEKIEKEIVELEHKKKDDSTIKNVLQEFLEFHKLDRTVLVLLIEKVVIHLDKSIEIHFTFTEPTKNKVA